MEIPRHWRLRGVRVGPWKMPREVLKLWQEGKITMAQAMNENFWQSPLCQALLGELSRIGKSVDEEVLNKTK